MNPIHPKTGGAAIGGTLGILVTAILAQIGVHLAPELLAAIPAVLAAGLSFLSPSELSGIQGALGTLNRPQPEPAPAPPDPIPPG